MVLKTTVEPSWETEISGVGTRTESIAKTSCLNGWFMGMFICCDMTLDVYIHTPYSVLRTPYYGYDDDDRPIRVKGGVDGQNISRRWNGTKTPIRSKNFPFLSGPFSLKANRVVVEMQENPRIEALPSETITPIQTTHAKKKQPPGPLVHLLAGA